MARNYTPTSLPEELEARKRTKFLRVLYETGGFVERTIRECKTSRRWFNETCNSDEEFNAMVEMCLNATNEVIEEEIYRRGVQGFDEPLMYKGMMVGTVRKYSDNLLMFLAKARMPAKYRDLPQKGDAVTTEEMNAVIKEWRDKKLARAQQPTEAPGSEAVS